MNDLYNNYDVCYPGALKKKQVEDEKKPPTVNNSNQKGCNSQLQVAATLMLLFLVLAVIVILQLVTIIHLDQALARGYNENMHMIAQFNHLIMNYNENKTDLLHEILEDLQASVQNVIEELASLKNGSLLSASDFSDSCQEIKQKQPCSNSGYYNIKGVLTYCHMEMLCNDVEGGWTRIDHFNISDSNVSCPSELKLNDEEEVRVCGRSNKRCSSIKIPSNGISYSQVCGRVVGYQYGLPDAISKNNTNDSADARNDINSYYVDGVSITQGDPRKHIWTLMAGNSSYNNSGNCPCNSSSSNEQEVQSFVGEDYFCESGNNLGQEKISLYANDPLWDGKNCSKSEENCCLSSSLPWFHKVFKYSSCDYIEIRLCGDEDPSMEDTPISFYEIFVK